ncbi:putative hydro-lyase [Saccharopolyspora spinosa]|uniref:putative hydro-lyase n=1 Tax=Saccharopolyspora spinosa TaxID=60894 RepID=UPI001659B382|nr:putative hydro-lyase [Saccharopolyspora spinosa]
MEFVDLQHAEPIEAWRANRANAWARPTSGICHGFVQANLVMLPQDDAFDFMRFAQRNPKPCPILEVTDAGDPEPKLTAPGADLRTDLPKYSVYREGALVEERSDVVDLWTDDMVAFLFGCSFSFEHLLLDAGLPIRHIDQGINGPVYLSNRECVPAGQFRGKLVVSMRPMPPDRVAEAVTITHAHPEVHGGPVHIGSPEKLGIDNVDEPDWGERVRMEPGDVPVFWACGVTPQQAAIEAKTELMITHSTGHMFVTGMRIDSE